VIYPPVDTSFFTPAEGRGKVAAGSEGSEGAPFLIVAALVPYKGVERTIRVANRRGLPLRVVGSGPELSRLRALAGRTVRFEEWISMEALRDAYRGCRALIQAHEEDFGIAPLEAMACGRPVIALRKGGASEVVTTSTGVLFDEATEEGLSAAIDTFESRKFDPTELRRHAVTFDRQLYRGRMEALLHQAVLAFQDRDGEPFPVDRLAGGCAKQATVL
jgi:glycosyltransferase involved in cell wall biosynthesis